MDLLSIMKLLEYDEDESIHSGANVEALSTALSRDIGGDSSTFFQPSEPESVGILPQPSCSASQHLLEQWQTTGGNEVLSQNIEVKEQHPDSVSSEQHSSQTESAQEVFGAKNQDQQSCIQPKHEQSQLKQGLSFDQQRQTDKNAPQSVVKNQIKTSNQTSFLFSQQDISTPRPESHERCNHRQSNIQQQSTATNEGDAPAEWTGNSSSIPFKLFIPILRPHLDKDRSMQLDLVFNKLKTNEISKEGFLRVIRNIAGAQMVRQATYKVFMQVRAPAALNQQNINQYSLKKQALQQQILSCEAQMFHEPQAFSSLNAIPSTQNAKCQRSPPRQPVSASTIQMEMGTMFPFVESSGQKSIDVENNSHGRKMYAADNNVINPEREVSRISFQAVNKQQQLSHRPHTSITMYGGNFRNFPSYQYARRPIGATTSLRSQLQDSHMRQASLTQGPLASRSASQQLLLSWQAMANRKQKCTLPLMPDLNQKAVHQLLSPPVVGTTTRSQPKKPSLGQKRPLEPVTYASAMTSKKRKMPVVFHDQSIGQLNDVTVVSGVNMREEEEQLFSAPKRVSRAFEATRRVVKEEEERLFLQKCPLLKKLAEIMFNCGLKRISSDVERCLSTCVEERLRIVISSMMRLSRQRIDIESRRHHVVITSDVHRQLLAMYRKANEEYGRKQSEEAEPEGGNMTDAAKDKDEGRSKTSKANKEEDEKMRATAANAAARAAVGVDDMLSKWQLMAEQARLKREGMDAASSLSRNFKRGPSSMSLSGGSRNSGKSLAMMPQPRVACNLTRKDVIAVLEMEPQMSKSTLIFRLYEKLPDSPME